MSKVGDHFYLDLRGIHAEGVVTETGFRVLKDSEVRNWQASFLAQALIDLRKQCFEDGTIIDWHLSRDMDFNSSSTACTFLFGSNGSGPASWKDENGVTMLKLDKVENGKMESIGSEYLSFFKTVEGNEGSKCHYPTRLDTYGCGCGHDCSYCYAKDMIVNFGHEWNPTNPRYVDIKRVETRLKKVQPGTIVRLGGMTDCFQPIELKRHLTLETIKLMNKYGIGYLIVTKSHHVADPEYVKIMDPALAHIQITVTTFDDALAAKYEKASAPTKRVDKSVLSDGMTIPEAYQEAMYAHLGRRLGHGEAMPIEIRMNGQVFAVRLSNLAFDTRKYSNHHDILQIRYTKGSPIAEALRTVFSRTRDRIGILEKQRTGRERIMIPTVEQEYLMLYAAEGETLLMLEPVTLNDISSEMDQLTDLPETRIEEILAEDETAGIDERFRITKVRRMNRAIGDALKNLYGWRCQICGAYIGEAYGARVIQAHHIDYFSRSRNNDASNILVVCPNHHTIIHDRNPVFNGKEKAYHYPNGYAEGLKLNKHL